ncbi:MAG: AMP-binding protein, partial [Bacteroidales bacterium]|nr:AMP-binding protein [Bacteroidales bacterium]
YRQLTLNGKTYSGVDELLLLCKMLEEMQGEEWTFQVASFLRDWLSDNPVMQLQTSGSTGKPKIIEMPKSAMIASALKTISFLGLKAGNSALLCLSPGYIAGKMMLVRALTGSFNLFAVEVKSNPLKDWALDVDFAAMVPTQVEVVLNENPEALNHIKQLIIGGGAVSSSLKELLYDVSTKVWETYGMTETVSHVAIRKIAHSSHETPFTGIPGVCFSNDERGCLVIEAPDLVSGPIVTNDIVRLVDDKHFFLLGRWDNVINTGGVKVFPEVIEKKLSTVVPHPFVVVGLPDERWGQRVVLVIEGNETAASFSEEIIHATDRYERPREVAYVSSFPYTATGKINRLELIRLLVNR